MIPLNKEPMEAIRVRVAAREAACRGADVRYGEKH